MSACVRLYRRRQDVQRRHVAVVAVGVVLHHFHRLELLEARFLSDLIFAFVRVVLQVSHISDIADVTHLVAKMLQIAV